MASIKPLCRKKKDKTREDRASDFTRSHLLKKENTNKNNNLYIKEELFKIPVEKIFANPNQPRKSFSKQSLEELCLSIKAQGLLQPITVRRVKDQYEIIAGERRFRAAQMAGFKEVLVLIKDHINNQKSMELALIENLQREDLNILEEALGYQTLMNDYQLSQKDLALRLGKNRSSIANVLRILALPEDVKEKLKQGDLALGHAKVLLSLDSPKSQSQLAKKVVQKNWSVRLLEREVRKMENQKDEPKPKNPYSMEPWLGELRKKMEKIFGTKVDILYQKGRGQIKVSFYSDEELSRFYEKIKA